MSLSKSLLMAIVLVLGVLFVWQYEQQHAEQQGLQADELVFDGLTAEGVQKFSIIFEGTTYPLTRSPDDASLWILRNPLGARIDQQVADELLETIFTVRVRNSLSREETDADQSIYGLQPPELFLVMEGSFGRRVVSFGKEHKLSGRRYLQPEHDDRIYLVDGEVFKQITELLGTLRNQQPLRFSVESVQSLTVINSSGQSLVFTRHAYQMPELGRWQMTVGEQHYPADTELVERELRELHEITAIRLHDNVEVLHMPVYGIGTPLVAGQIRLSSANMYGEQDIGFRIGEGVATVDATTAGGAPMGRLTNFIKVADDPTLYQFERAAYTDWMQPPEHFLHKRPFLQADFSKVATFYLQLTANRTLRVDAESSPEAWKQLTAAMGGLTVLSYQPLALEEYRAYGVDAPRYTIVADQMLLAIGKPLAATGKSADTEELQPHYCLIKNPTGDTLLAVVSGVEVEDLRSLLEELAAR